LLQPSAEAMTQLPSKILEYALTGKPILALAPRASETGVFMEKHALGVLEESTDPACIKRSLSAVLALRGSFRSRFDPAQYSKRNLAADLAGSLDALLPRASADQPRM
jgi:hypothetical protein